jgi:putative membrane protein insertion efficiency factor
MSDNQLRDHRGWLQVAALAAIDVYQVTLRLMNPWGCRFYPSCSHYAREAIELHGPGSGPWLAARRLLRCRPGIRGGFDPVPELVPPAEAESSVARGEEMAT